MFELNRMEHSDNVFYNFEKNMDDIKKNLLGPRDVKRRLENDEHQEDATKDGKKDEKIFIPNECPPPEKMLNQNIEHDNLDQ